MALGKAKWSNKPGTSKRSLLAIRTQGLTSKSDRAREDSQVPDASHKSAQAHGTAAPVTPALTDVQPSLSDAVTDASPATAMTNGTQPDGGEIDFRMAKIEEILDHAAMHLIEKCALVAEWVHHAEVKLSSSGQLVQNHEGGRPEGGVARASRVLRLPGRTPEARRKFVERAIKIDGIWPEAKSAARDAGLDDIQSALLAIARERSLEAQLAKVQEIKTHKAMPRRKAKIAAEPEKTDGANLPGRDTFDAPALPPTSHLVMNAEEEAHLAIMRTFWRRDKVLPREEWDRASRAEQDCFVRVDLLGMPIRELRVNMQDEANVRPASSAAETFSAGEVDRSEMAESEPRGPDLAAPDDEW
jgi:hypothetical protein